MGFGETQLVEVFLKMMSNNCFFEDDVNISVNPDI